MEQELLTISRLKSYRACPRRHHYEYALGMRPMVLATPLRVGTLAHEAIETYWRARQTGDETAHEQAVARVENGKSRVDEFEHARLLVMVEAYCMTWDARAVEVLAVETEFQLPLVNPRTGAPSTRWRLGGKIDLVLRLADGRIAIVEHKTTSADLGAGMEYRDRLLMDGQVTLYFRGGEALGHAVDVCIYDVLVKPALRPLKATPVESQKRKKDGSLYAGQREHDETPQEYGVRIAECFEKDAPKYLVTIEVPRLESERTESDWDVWQTAARMREDTRSGHAPRNPDACHRYGSACPFLAVCQHRADINDPTLFRHEGAHPELRVKLPVVPSAA